MDVTFADLHAMDIELLPGREALGVINIGLNLNVAPAIAVQVLTFGSANTAVANPVQALVQS
jgi:hypothetical protein